MNDSKGSKTPKRNPVFDYVTLRLLVGLIAFLIPIIVVSLARPSELESISASYHTDAQDAFVGMLFIVSAFLCAYRGHSRWQNLMSKLGSAAAVVVAVCPTSTRAMPDLATGPIHYAAAAILFLILVFFCYVFWDTTRKSVEVMKKRRSPVYAACGIIMLICIAVIPIAKVFFPDRAYELRITFWGEWAALWMFGAAWIVAGKSLPGLSKPTTEGPQIFSDIRALLKPGEPQSQST